MSRNRNRKPTLGTVSHGTLRDRDLIPTLLDELTRIAPGKARTIRKEWHEVLEAVDNCDGIVGDVDHDDAPELTNVLMDTLDAEAPPYCYFGANEGDGSDFGFWPSVESLLTDAADPDGEVWRDPDDGSKMPSTAAFRVVVSDHGNVSLYYRNGREVWSVV